MINLETAKLGILGMLNKPSIDSFMQAVYATGCCSKPGLLGEMDREPLTTGLQMSDRAVWGRLKFALICLD